VPDVDDSDDPPEEAFEAWRLRELTRLMRDKQAASARADERAEIERRREMPEEQRMREDVERAKKLREEKQARAGQVFGQKFSHKGAFHQVRSLDGGLCLPDTSLTSRMDAFSARLRRTTISSKIATTQPRPSRPSISRFSQRSCRSATLARCRRPSTHTSPTRTRVRRGRVGPAAALEEAAVARWSASAAAATT
jgi:hypothetical protein